LVADNSFGYKIVPVNEKTVEQDDIVPLFGKEYNWFSNSFTG
jgi:hypothetical protein